MLALSTFLLDHRHAVSLVAGTLGVLIAIAAIVLPRRKPVIRVSDWYQFTADDLAPHLGLGRNDIAQMRRERFL